jgi:AbrB family looped-hinge helix DNA binding protein
MKLAQSRLTAQGQISVPAEVRRRLDLVPGSVLEWEAAHDVIVVRRAGRHSSGALHQALFLKAPVARSLGEIKAGVRQHLKARHARR